MRIKKLLTVVLIVIIIAATLFILFPMVLQKADIIIKYYNSNGEEVHLPYNVNPFAAVFDGPGGQEVVTFTVTVTTYTNDPDCGWVDYQVDLRTHYLVTDSVPPETRDTFTGTLWMDRTTVSYWENGIGTKTSQEFVIRNYVGDLPDDHTFYMDFTGFYIFYYKWDVTSSDPVYRGDMAPSHTTLYHGAYEYDAWFGT